MVLTRAQENKNKAISASITLALFTLLMLFLIFYHMITPNPPFPESGGGGGQELTLGMMEVGNDDLDYGTMGKVTDVVTKTEVKEKIVTVEDGVDIGVTETKPEIKNNTTVITPVKPKPVVKELTEVEKAIEKYKKKSEQSGGGKGKNETAGEIGLEDGNELKPGSGGTGGVTGGGNGESEGPNTGQGIGSGGKIGISLIGRTVVQPPKLPSDTREEGKVVVEIVVNSEGKVTEAIPNGRGTTTSSPALKAKAKQAALATKFNVDGKFEEQKGTITIIFSFN